MEKETKYRVKIRNKEGEKLVCSLIIKEDALNDEDTIEIIEKEK